MLSRQPGLLLNRIRRRILGRAPSWPWRGAHRIASQDRRGPEGVARVAVVGAGGEGRLRTMGSHVMMAAGAVPTPSMFAPVSTPAFAIREVSFLVLAIVMCIFVVVAGLTVYAIVRYRQRPGDDR